MIKPAIKEHFFYATGCKAWRADTREELVERLHAAAALIGNDEVLVQELIPGQRATRSWRTARFFNDGAGTREHGGEPAPPASRRVRAGQHVRADDRVARARGRGRLGSSAPSATTASSSSSSSTTRATGTTKLLDVNARTWGYHSLGQRAGVDFPYLLYADQVGLELTRSAIERAPGVSWVRLATDVPTAALELARRRLDWRGYARSLRSRTRSRSSASTIRVLASPSWRSPVSRG